MILTQDMLNEMCVRPYHRSVDCPTPFCSMTIKNEDDVHDGVCPGCGVMVTFIDGLVNSV